MNRRRWPKPRRPRWYMGRRIANCAPYAIVWVAPVVEAVTH